MPNRTKGDQGGLAGDLERFFAPVEPVREGNLWINQPYRQLLISKGLDRFEAFWRFSEGELIKKIKTRSVMRFSLDYEGKQHHFFIKRHRKEWAVLPLAGRKWLPDKSLSQGRMEFENYALFRRHGFATAHPVAAGERRVQGLWVESFLVTEDFAPFVSLEDMIREQPSLFEGPGGERAKKELLHQVAQRAKQMHQCGFHHLDFNATHILLHFGKSFFEKPRIGFFDLQRVSKNRFFRWRWMIKGLARLNHTLPPHLFSEADRLYLFLSYKGRTRFDLLSRFQWFWLKRKTERIRKHTRKVDKVKAQQRAQLEKTKI